MKTGSLVEWIGANGTAEEGYGIVFEATDKHVKVYWLRIEDETYLTLNDGTVVYSLDGVDIKTKRLVEVTCK